MNKEYLTAQSGKRKQVKYPFVKIGNQYWTTKNFAETSTVLGTPIREIQLNANVEKITNIADREFSGDTGWWLKSGETIIANGLCNIKTTTAATSGLEKSVLLTSGKWYKLKYDVLANRNGGLQIYNGSYVQEVSSTVGNNKVFYFLAGGVYFNIAIRGLIVDIDIDNISIQEIAWSGSRDLYDGIYAQTSGTAEQKMYAAVKAAGWWCDYNNLAANGLIYGHLYNWFAVKLIQMDIDYYNAQLLATYGNTPDYYTRRYIWKMPTEQNFIDLSNTLGGNAVSGGKLKKEGTTFWNSPNTGADNIGGFSAFGGGIRFETDGVFQNLKGENAFYSISETNSTTVVLLRHYYNLLSTEITSRDKIRGNYIRLIKS